MATVEYLDFGQSPICLVDATGIHRPPFEDIVDYLESGLRLIFGQDLYLDSDCQDGQFVGLLSIAINNINAALVEAYNSYSPATAQGVGLSSVVKTNGITRDVAGYSTADLLLTGQAGQTIYNGYVTDSSGYQWILPTTVLFPYTGQVTVTAQCATIGAIPAPAGDISNIGNPQLGWQTATNPVAATPGAPVEDDPTLKAGQTISTALPSSSLTEGMRGGLASLPNVSRVHIEENDTDQDDPDTGVPAHTLAAVVEGGDIAAIANLIRVKKGQGVNTYGDIVQPSVDAYGVTHSIALSRPDYVPLAWYIRVKPLSGYTADVEAAIQSAVATWASALGYGATINPGQAYAPALLAGTPGAQSFLIERISVTRDGAGEPDSPSDVILAWNELPQSAPADVLVIGG